MTSSFVSAVNTQGSAGRIGTKWLKFIYTLGIGSLVFKGLGSGDSQPYTPQFPLYVPSSFPFSSPWLAGQKPYRLMISCVLIEPLSIRHYTIVVSMFFSIIRID